MPIRLINYLRHRLLGRHAAEKSSPGASHPGSERVPREPGHVHPQDKRRPHRPPRHAPTADWAPGRKPEKPRAPWSVEEFQVEPAEGKVRFHDLGLPPELMHAIADLNFHYCTPIQAKCLQLIVEGRDIAGRAQTGTGKTAAFLIAIFVRFLRRPAAADRPSASPRALVLAPTRELAVQIIHDAHELAKYTPIRCVAVYGGMDYDRQIKELESGRVDLVAATPGRLLDFMRSGKIHLKDVEELVIDEADRMLDMGFIPDVKRIIRALPPRERRRSTLFSATLTDDVRRLAATWMTDPLEVAVDPDQVAVDTVQPVVYSVTSREKFTVLVNLLKRPGMDRVLVFGNRRDSTQRLADHLTRYGIKCVLLSGDVAQKARMRVLDDFRSGRVKVLVATDVAARGLHIDNVTHVVNYDLPYEPQDYVHRIGRTGRAGASGVAISFACEDQSFTIPEIETYIGASLLCTQPEPELLERLPDLPPGAQGAGPSSGAPRRPAGAPYRGGDRRPPPRRSGPPRRSR